MLSFTSSRTGDAERPSFAGIGGGPISPRGDATSRTPIAPGISPRPAALETVNLTPPDDVAKGEDRPGVVPKVERGLGRGGGNKLIEPPGIDIPLECNGIDVRRGTDVNGALVAGICG
jgi:hypothetical protein